jgi:hypothetical protein
VGPTVKHGLFPVDDLRSWRRSPNRPSFFANETLYQLSYTPNLTNFAKLPSISRSRKDAGLHRHEIIGNYYAQRKIRSQIESALYAR